MIIRDAEKWLNPYNIKCFRKYLQLTQVDFSRALGLAQKSFAKYETGAATPIKSTRVLLSIIEQQPFILLEIMPPDLARQWIKRMDIKSRLFCQYYYYLLDLEKKKKENN